MCGCDHILEQPPFGGRTPFTPWRRRPYPHSTPGWSQEHRNPFPMYQPGTVECLYWRTTQLGAPTSTIYQVGVPPLVSTERWHRCDYLVRPKVHRYKWLYTWEYILYSWVMPPTVGGNEVVTWGEKDKRTHAMYSYLYRLLTSKTSGEKGADGHPEKRAGERWGEKDAKLFYTNCKGA
jgi:hypothetical protein